MTEIRAKTANQPQLNNPFAFRGRGCSEKNRKLPSGGRKRSACNSLRARRPCACAVRMWVAARARDIRESLCSPPASLALRPGAPSACAPRQGTPRSPAAPRATAPTPSGARPHYAAGRSRAPFGATPLRGRAPLSEYRFGRLCMNVDRARMRRCALRPAVLYPWRVF